VARIGTGEGRAGVLFGNQRKGDNLEDLVVNVRIILKCILKKSLRWTWNGLIWHRILTNGGLW
jgi:hypothetical protein